MSYIPPSPDDIAISPPEQKLLFKAAVIEVVGKWLYRLQLFLIAMCFLQWIFVYRLLADGQLQAVITMVTIGVIMASVLVVTVPVSILLEWQYIKYEELLNTVIFSRIDSNVKEALGQIVQSRTFDPRIKLFSGYKNKRRES